MSNFIKHISDTRRRLMSPVRAALDDAPLSEYVIEVIDELVTQLNQSNEPHYIQASTLTLQPGVAIYPLDSICPGYGKARYLYTVDETNPDFSRSPIEIVGFEALTEMYGGGNSNSLATVPYYPSWPPYKAAIYYSLQNPGPGNYIEFSPVLSDTSSSVTVKFIWEPMTVRPQSKTDTGLRLDQFDPLVAAKSAMLALPHCEWKGLNAEATAARKSEIRSTLAYQLGSIAERRGLEYLFWSWRQSNQNRVKPNAVGWAEGRW